MGATTGTQVRTGWVVRDRAGGVVVILTGADADAAADAWRHNRGYRVDAVELD